MRRCCAHMCRVRMCYGHVLAVRMCCAQSEVVICSSSVLLSKLNIARGVVVHCLWRSARQQLVACDTRRMCSGQRAALRTAVRREV